MGQMLGSGLGMGIVNQFRNLGNSMGNGTNVADPGQSWGNMDSSQRGAALIGGAAKGLGKGIQSYQQQNQALRQPGGGGMPVMGGSQPVDPSYFSPQDFRNSPQWNAYNPDPGMSALKPRSNMLNFYGGGS